MRQTTYQGIHVPIITPFRHGEIDWEGLGLLIDSYCDAKVASIIACGTTGEASTLSHDEHRNVTEYAVQRAAGRVPVIAATGSNSTREAISLTEMAAQAGAKASLVVTPYYNRPTSHGIYTYFKEIARAVPGFDLLIYNIPTRTGSCIELDTVTRLADDVPEIKGIKEGSGNIQYLIDLAHHFVGRDFSVLTGEDSLLLSLCANGGDGGVMAAACVCPRQLIELFDAVKACKLDEARVLDRRLRPLVKALFWRTNPIVVKYALSRLFAISDELRSPLLPLEDSMHERVDEVLRAAGFALSSEALCTTGDPVNG